MDAIPCCLSDTLTSSKKQEQQFWQFFESNFPLKPNWQQSLKFLNVITSIWGTDFFVVVPKLCKYSILILSIFARFKYRFRTTCDKKLNFPIHTIPTSMPFFVFYRGHFAVQFGDYLPSVIANGVLWTCTAMYKQISVQELRVLITINLFESFSEQSIP